MRLRRPLPVPLLVVLAAAALLATTAAAPAPPDDDRVVDLQAHRGGSVLSVESSLQSFGTALDLGVHTLELDVQITADGHAVVTHDRRTSDEVCTDTAPVAPGDPQFPYVGKYVKDLTLDRIRTMDCGSVRRPAYPAQTLSPGARMLELHEVFALARDRGADDVRFNVETKVEAAAPEETAPREQFVQVVADEVRRAGVVERTTVQSFDLAALDRMREVAPELDRILLMNESFLELGEPGRSPWLNGLDADDLGADPATALVAAARTVDASAISPVHGTPQSAGTTAPGYTPFTTAATVRAAHDAGLAVIPWTVNDVPTMDALLDLGVDGIITDAPDRARWVFERRGLPLPSPHPAG
ncbi:MULTISPECIES: glycerophosphodiester phosphodiesterase family protein [unclassified Pseudonocardia]|uniref:glycerophosphodiester phosphodiesterase family protein n=1 Tax=unclassified Pseudonocardia TaxID=2619320 RepID=UPI000A94F297|nr:MULTISPECIES: glycerophosphodiester phosphodiesterase family protein [unclassified Pseudonocardia]